MNNLQIGYAEENINPKLGIAIEGYYVPRFAKGILSDLKVISLAIKSNGTTVLLLSLDLCEIDNGAVKKIKTSIANKTGVCEDNVIVTATHTHTGPCLIANHYFNCDEKPIKEYLEFIILYPYIHKLYRKYAHNRGYNGSDEQLEQIYLYPFLHHITDFKHRAAEYGGDTEYERERRGGLTGKSAEQSRRDSAAGARNSRKQCNALEQTYDDRVPDFHVLAGLIALYTGVRQNEYDRGEYERAALEYDVSVALNRCEEVLDEHERHKYQRCDDDHEHHSAVIVHFAPPELSLAYITYSKEKFLYHAPYPLAERYHHRREGAEVKNYRNEQVPLLDIHKMLCQGQMPGTGYRQELRKSLYYSLYDYAYDLIHYVLSPFKYVQRTGHCSPNI